ncbi:MAG: hypothetical protein B7C54_00165 [Acidimicrobiales bacterium mtb01]|nr:MAG: hypothetical protein B7C54_00165 [Acidimicrobiales bacterium mtb01]
MAAGAGCSPSSGSTDSTNQQQNVATTDDVTPLPLEDRLTRVLGHSLAEIFRAVESVRRDWIVTCVTDRGWMLTAEQQRNLGPAPAPGSGYAEQIADAIESGELAAVASGQQEAEDPAFAGAVTDCVSKAESEFPNPNASILDQLEQFNVDVAGRAQADPRTVAAASEREECLASTGIAAGPGGSLADALAFEIDSVVSSFVSSGLGSEEAVRELRQLAQAERLVADCLQAYANVEDMVVGEVQTDLLGQNPGLLEGIAEQVVVELQRYEQYLDSDPST